MTPEILGAFLAQPASVCQVARSVALPRSEDPPTMDGLMTPTPQSDDRTPASLDRRDFLSRLGGAALVVGSASPTLGLLSIFPEAAATPGSVFRPASTDPDAAVFAEARKHFLIPK